MLMKLHEVKHAQTCKIIKMDMRQEAIKRLLHVGVYVGCTIRMEQQGRRHKPSLLYVCGNLLMLRYEDCMRIEVEVSSWENR